MATTVISDLYEYVRSIVGDNGVYDASGNVVANSYYWHNNVIKSAIKLVVLDTSSFSVTNDDYITPQLSNRYDMRFIIYSAALMLLLPERDKSIKTPHFTITKDDLEKQIGYIWSQIEKSMNSGNIAYSSDGSLTHMYNLATRLYEQVSDISDPEAPAVIPNDFIEVRDEDGNIVQVSTDL